MVDFNYRQLSKTITFVLRLCMQYVRRGPAKMPRGMMNKITNMIFIIWNLAFSEPFLWITNESLTLFKILRGNFSVPPRKYYMEPRTQNAQKNRQEL